MKKFQVKFRQILFSKSYKIRKYAKGKKYWVNKVQVDIN